MQLPQLFFVDRRRRPRHEIDGLRGLWKRDDVPDRRFSAEDGDRPIQADRDAAVRGCPVFERVEEEAEAEPRFVV
jgi:hypothetical protein